MWNIIQIRLTIHVFFPAVSFLIFFYLNYFLFLFSYFKFKFHSNWNHTTPQHLFSFLLYFLFSFVASLFPFLINPWPSPCPLFLLSLLLSNCRLLVTMWTFLFRLFAWYLLLYSHIYMHKCIYSHRRASACFCLPLPYLILSDPALSVLPGLPLPRFSCAE